MTATYTTLFQRLCGVFLLHPWGCATVNPQPDYARAVASIQQATGETIVYQPEKNDLVANETQALLADGISAQEAVQICLLNNPRLQAAFFTVGTASADVVQSGLFSNPSFALSPHLPFPPLPCPQQLPPVTCAVAVKWIQSSDGQRCCQ